MFFFKKLRLFNKNVLNKKFILIIGDEGAVLLLVKGIGKNIKIEQRLFASLTYEDDLKKFSELFHKEIHAPIHLIINVLDQNYQIQTFPGVNGFALQKLIKKRLEREYNKNDFKAYKLLTRETTGRHDWVFLFISCPNIAPVSGWLDFIMEMPNYFEGAYLLPVELYSFIEALSDNIFPVQQKKSFFQFFKKTPKSHSKWQFIVIHNKVGGFRQVAFYEEKIVFTRLINIQTDSSPEYIAGDIKLEIENSLEYLGRNRFKDLQDLDIFIIVSQEIKNSLSKIKIKAKNLIILTPYESAFKLNLHHSSQQEDRFADSITGLIFALKTPLLKLVTPELRKLNRIIRAKKLAILPYLIIPFLIFYIFMIQLQISEIQTTIQTARNDKLRIEAEWKKMQQDTNLSADEIEKINDIIKLYKLLSGANISPLQTISDFLKIKDSNILVKKLDWKIREKYNPQIPNSKTIIQATYDTELINHGLSYQELFDNLDQFIKRLKIKFSDYDIEYTRSNEKISFNETNKSISLQINIVGPKKKVK